MEDLLLGVCEAARAAGMRMLNAGEVRVREKEGHANFVTNLDEAVQAQLIEALTPMLAGARFIAEEKQNEAAPDGYAWVIDPIDGTQNFISGLRHSAVSVALLRDGWPVLGAVYDPYADELFAARVGGGARLNGREIRVSERAFARGVIAFGTAPYNLELTDRSFAAAKAVFLACCDVRRSGSAALDLCGVAAGRFEGYFELRLSPWDYAAGSLIVQEAGGRVGAIAPDVWGFERPIGVLAAPPQAFDALKALVEGVKGGETP